MGIFDQYVDVFAASGNMQKAVITGDIELAKSSIKAGVDINDSPVDSPYILIAAQNEHWAMVKFLMENDAKCDVKNRYGFTLAHQIVLNAPVEVIKELYPLLIEKGVAVNRKDTLHGDTPFLLAIKNDRDDVVDYLFSLEDVSKSSKDDNGKNTLHHAAIMKKKELFIRLWEAGVPMDAPDKQNKFPADYIEDPAWKAQLPTIENTFKNMPAEDEKESKVEVVVSKDVLAVEEDKPKVAGLSSIKKRR